MRKRRDRIDGEWQVAGAGAALALIGWVVDGRYLAVLGLLVAATALLLWVWGRKSLAGVGYRRSLSRTRAMFGERVAIDLELVNDKVLPLTWLHVREQVPSSLRLEDSSIVAAGRGRTEMQLVVAMLPYQRVRRRLTVRCDQRGEHVFGPAELRSGSPLGTREQTREVRNQTSLLVYPKVVPLSAPLVSPRVPVPDRRVRRSLALDPSRPVGVRPYQPGDPARHVDWRASARRGELLVRVHEPATTLSVCVFVDLLPPARTTAAAASDLIELIVSVAACTVSHLVGAGVPTGLFVNGMSRGSYIAVPPSAGDRALPAMLDALARVTPFGAVPLERTLLEHGSRLGAGVSAVVVASDFPDPVSLAVADVRRRVALSALWVASEKGRGPAPGTVDAQWQVRYEGGWRDRDVLELVG